MSTPSRPVVAPPRTIIASYWLHVVGAVIGLVGAVVSFLALPATIDQAVAVARRAGTQTNGVDLTTFVTGAAVGGAALSAAITLAFSVLTIVFARRMRQGRNWARIVLIVFAALQVLGVAGSLGVGALHFLIVLAALILSVVPASNAWFREVNPRAAVA